MRILAALSLISGFVIFIQAFSAYAGHGSNFTYSLNHLLNNFFPNPEIPLIFYTIGLMFFSSLIFLVLSIFFGYTVLKTLISQTAHDV